MRRRLAWSVIGLIALAACGDPSTQLDSNAQSPSAAAVGTASPAAPSSQGAVPESLAFSAPRVGGGTVDMSDFAGKPVLLWFWAPT